MARRPGADPIYEVADLYRSRCLGQGRSLLWPARPSFTIENLQELWDAYIENPDLSKKSFYEKWELQLQNRSADVHRVAADLTVLYNLYPSTYWPSWKREQVLSVASWKLANDSPELGPIVAAFEAGGIGSAGPYYNFGRPWQFAFYLKFSQRMLRSGADLQSLDAVKATALAAEEDVGHACAEARNIVLYLLFPDDMERIASEPQRRMVLETYAKYAGETDDIDQALGNIRTALVEQTGRAGLDFYDDDIEPVWNPKPPPPPTAPPQSGTRYWIEKTIVKGQPHRLEGQYKLGSALLSPQKAKGGADFYRFMREVKPGDIVLHLVDNRSIVGVSVVEASAAELLDPPIGSWEGDREGYVVPLRDYTQLDPELSRDTFFSAPYWDRMSAILQSGEKNLFYNSKAELNQGCYLTPAPEALVDILNDAYEQVAGHSLVVLQPRRSWVFQSNPDYFDLHGAVKAVGQMTWLVSAHKSKIKVGDTVYLYESGPDAGVVAVTQVISGPEGMDEPEDTKPFEIDGERFEGPRLRVLLKIDRVVGPRVLREELLANPVLAQVGVFKGTMGTNFQLSAEEASALRKLCSGDRIGPVGPNPQYALTDFSADTGLELALLSRWVRALERKGQAVFYGPPGTGKTYVAERMARHLTGGGTGFWELVQFHPSYAYEDFIQGIRPSTSVDGELRFDIVEGRFLDFCRRAAKTNDRCVLIVDEINRANLSRVFGELMYLLEYRERAVPLAGGRQLQIPRNVRLLGTMNTADRSIALVDHALRRRFAFLALRPDYEVLERFHQREETGFPVDGLAHVLRAVNNQINDPNYEVGITFFMRDDLAEQIEDVWCMEVLPYLEEYFFDQPEKIADFRWEKVEGQILV